ncbi:MAG: CPBP family intramembrane metalloprotease [Proteobacteria bacterium]|nr:CPBP family intramembrane metalloprotease [Pseudomonadota bacterium]
MNRDQRVVYPIAAVVLSVIFASFLIGELYSSVSALNSSFEPWLNVLIINMVIGILSLLFIRSIREQFQKFAKGFRYYVPGLIVLFGSLFLAIMFRSPSVSGDRHELYFSLFSITLIPIFEEIVYRGLVFELLANQMKSHWRIYIGAIIFSFVHTMPTFAHLVRMEIGLPIGPFLLGLVCGWLVDKSGSLWPAIVFHCAGNCTVLIFSWLSPDWLDKLSVFYL